MEWGKKAAAEISKTFDDPIKLEFEKVYHPYLLIAKKRYAGVYYTNYLKPDKVDKETEVEKFFLQHCDILRFIGNYPQKLFFLDLEVMINLTNNLIFKAEQ